MAKKKLTKAERAERETQRTQMRANAQRTRELAELAQVKLKDSTGRRFKSVGRHSSLGPLFGNVPRLFWSCNPRSRDQYDRIAVGR